MSVAFDREMCPEPAMAPSVWSDASTSVPLLIVVVPAKLLAPARIRLPVPFFVKEPEPISKVSVPNVISPFDVSSSAPPLMLRFINPPLALDAPVIVRFAPEIFESVAFPLTARVRFDEDVKFPPPA